MPWNQKCEAAHLGGCYGRLDPDHIFTRGAGGSDKPFNLAWLCRYHHTERHAIGGPTFYYQSMPLRRLYNRADRCRERIATGKKHATL